jgi:hypothetical protein
VKTETKENSKAMVAYTFTKQAEIFLNKRYLSARRLMLFPGTEKEC